MNEDKHSLLIERINNLRRTILFIGNQIELSVKQLENGDEGMAKLILRECMKDKRYVYR